MSRVYVIIPALFALGACSALPAAQKSSETQYISQEVVQPIPGAGLPQITRNPDGGQCLRELGAQQASFQPIEDRYYGDGCTALNAVQLAAVPSDLSQLGISNIGPVTCPVASAFAAWARYGVDRAARVYLGSPLRRIETFGSYSCRNVAGSGRRSAHASAAAIDVSAFVLEDGRRISVLEGWSTGDANVRTFLRISHDSACKRFGTVLGPDYNAAHENHFHLEGVTDGNSYCR